MSEKSRDPNYFMMSSGKVCARKNPISTEIVQVESQPSDNLRWLIVITESDFYVFAVDHVKIHRT